MSHRDKFEIAGASVRPGGRVQSEIPIGRLMSGTPVAIPVVVLHGEDAGPVVWLNAATHGDEINGVEIIRRVLETLDPRSLRGTVIAVPILNVHGFNTGDRYLPDRRDLNRSFPGSARGSLAARIANLMMSEVVETPDEHPGSGGLEHGELGAERVAQHRNWLPLLDLIPKRQPTVDNATARGSDPSTRVRDSRWSSGRHDFVDHPQAMQHPKDSVGADGDRVLIESERFASLEEQAGLAEFGCCTAQGSVTNT